MTRTYKTMAGIKTYAARPTEPAKELDGVHILQLQPNQCHWPVNCSVEPPYNYEPCNHFCGARAHLRGLCEEHYAVTWQPKHKTATA